VGATGSFASVEFERGSRSAPGFFRPFGPGFQPFGEPSEAILRQPRAAVLCELRHYGVLRSSPNPHSANFALTVFPEVATVPGSLPPPTPRTRVPRGCSPVWQPSVSPSVRGSR
jgi:hypothetical protein